MFCFLDMVHSSFFFSFEYGTLCLDIRLLGHMVNSALALTVCYNFVL